MAQQPESHPTLLEGDTRLSLMHLRRLVAAMALAFTACLAWQNGLGVIDHTIYDTLLRWSPGFSNPGVALITIDPESIEALGPWPWPHGLHAALLSRLREVGARAIGLDLPPLGSDLAAPRRLTQDQELDFYRYWINEGDDGLFREIRRSGHVAVAVTSLGDSWNTLGIGPLAPISAMGPVVAFAGYRADTDGLVRRAELGRLADLSRGVRPAEHLAAATITAEHDSKSQLPACATGQWYAPLYLNCQVGIAISTRPPPYDVYSYAAVLRGKVDLHRLRNKLVLIGTTAPELTIPYSVPVGMGESHQSTRLFAAELDAQLLASLISSHAIRLASPFTTTVISLLLAGAILVAFYALPQHAPRMLAAAAAIVLGLCALSFWVGRLWIPPATLLILCTTLLPLWRWRVLHQSWHLMERATLTLDRQNSTLLEPDWRANLTGTIEEGASFDLVRSLFVRMSKLSTFESEFIEQIPHAVLVANRDGHVLMANALARRYFAQANHRQIDAAQIAYLLGTLIAIDVPDDFTWWNMLDPHIVHHSVVGLDPQGQEIRVWCLPARDIDREVAGWVVTLQDISVFAASERRHEAALAFMSNELAMPKRAILALLDNRERYTPDDLRDRIEHHAQRALFLAEKFAMLSDAESWRYRFLSQDVSVLVQEAIDENMPLAKHRSITIGLENPERITLASVDAEMFWCAIETLIANAVRFSRRGSHVNISITTNQDSKEITVSVTDEGTGIAPAIQARIFRALAHIRLPGASQQSGLGMGLSLIRIVAERHGGRLEFTSNPGKGTEFRITVPEDRPIQQTYDLPSPLRH